MTDQQLRDWILADEGLYLTAREFGGGGDEEMYDRIYEFIEQNRDLIEHHIRTRRQLESELSTAQSEWRFGIRTPTQ